MKKKKALSYGASAQRLCRADSHEGLCFASKCIGTCTDLSVLVTLDNHSTVWFSYLEFTLDVQTNKKTPNQMVSISCFPDSMLCSFSLVWFQQSEHPIAPLSSLWVVHPASLWHTVVSINLVGCSSWATGSLLILEGGYITELSLIIFGTLHGEDTHQVIAYLNI